MPLTNSTSYPTTRPIGIVGASGGFVNAPPSVSSVTSGSGTNGGHIDILLPAQAVPETGYFTLKGVLGSLASMPTFTSVVANLSVGPGAGVFIVAGQNTVTVLNQILPGLASPRLSAGGAGVLSTTGAAVKPAWSVNVDEFFLDAYLSSTQFNGGAATNGTRLLLTLTGIPTGVTIADCTVAATVSGSPSPGNPFLLGGVAAFSAASNTVSIEWGGNPSVVATERVAFACNSIIVGPGATLPFYPGNITLTASFAPVGAAFGPGGEVLTSPTAGQIPRYQASPAPSPPLTVITISPLVLSNHKNQLISD